MNQAPVTTFERIEYLSYHTDRFWLEVKNGAFSVSATVGDDLDFYEAGKLEDLPDVINNLFYKFYPHF